MTDSHSGLSADNLLLSSWGLPSVVLDRYKQCGITCMFEWQAQCLCMGKVLGVLLRDFCMLRLWNFMCFYLH